MENTNMMEISKLLSDEFSEFSGNITALHEKRKEMVSDFKKLYEKHKSDIAAIDSEAEKIQNEFFNQQSKDSGE